MSEWNGNLWHIDVDGGKIGFGVKEYVEPEFRHETINVQESDRVRAELDINNNGTLNNGKIIDIDIANIIDTSDYTLVSVNGNGAASNNVTADMFGYLYGNQTVQLVVDAGYTRYTINLPMLLISKVIRTVDDYAAWVKIAIACENNGKRMAVTITADISNWAMTLRVKAEVFRWLTQIKKRGTARAVSAVRLTVADT